MTSSDTSGWDHVAGESVSPHLPLLHSTLSPVKIRISLMETACFHTVWYETLPQSHNFMFPKNLCILIKQAFYDCVPFVVISHFYYWYFISSSNPTLTTDSNVPFKNKT